MSDNANDGSSTGKWYSYASIFGGFMDGGWMERLNDGAVKVWLVLYKHAKAETLMCYPSATTIAKQAGLKSTGTVFRGLNELEAVGLVGRVSGRGRDSNRYYLAVPIGTGARLSVNDPSRRRDRSRRVSATGASATTQVVSARQCDRRKPAGASRAGAPARHELRPIKPWPQTAARNLGICCCWERAQTGLRNRRRPDHCWDHRADPHRVGVCVYRGPGRTSAHPGNRPQSTKRGKGHRRDRQRPQRKGGTLEVGRGEESGAGTRPA